MPTNHRTARSVLLSNGKQSWWNQNYREDSRSWLERAMWITKTLDVLMKERAWIIQISTCNLPRVNFHKLWNFMTSCVSNPLLLEASAFIPPIFSSWFDSISLIADAVEIDWIPAPAEFSPGSVDASLTNAQLSSECQASAVAFRKCYSNSLGTLLHRGLSATPG